MSYEDKLIEFWAQHLAPQKWAAFLRNWARAFLTYDTPLDLLSHRDFEPISISIANVKYSSHLAWRGMRELRERLWKNQSAYSPLKAIEAYSSRLERNCELCLHVAQALDAKELPESVRSNAISHIEKYVLVPNRYPAFAGASLLVPYEHDNAEQRAEVKLKGKSFCCPPEPKKTRGKLFSSEDLLVLKETCDRYNLVGSANHVLDAMSIPRHSHFHAHPSELPVFQHLNQLLNKQSAGLRIFEHPDTPFANLFVECSQENTLIDTTLSILRNLELNNEVFVFGYSKNTFIISPRINIGDTAVVIGGTSIMLDIDPSNERKFRTILHHIPLRGSFDWRKFSA